MPSATAGPGLAGTMVAAGLTVLLAACGPGDPPESGTTEAARAEAATLPAAYRPSASERQAILAPLQTLFDALEAGDGEMLRSVVAPGTPLSFAESTDGESEVRTTTLDDLADNVASSPVTLVERMWDPVVLVHGPLAQVWTPYDFYRGDELSHCGIDAATLLRDEDGWTIVGLSWTRDQPPQCALHPEGPPAQ
ncbi:MAG: hypothetical protein U5R14_00650 [Gemmatimonadota bacterium]|nr:hypothetical protein [Gemmatimonadota bacterium]